LGFWDIAFAEQAQAWAILFVSAYQLRIGTRPNLATLEAPRLAKNQMSTSAPEVSVWNTAKTPWSGMWFAIGMSQGFVEPLEASAIVWLSFQRPMLERIFGHQDCSDGVNGDTLQIPASRTSLGANSGLSAAALTC